MEHNDNSRSRRKMLQAMRRWQKIAKAVVGAGRPSSKKSDVPADVPCGHMAVYAGSHWSVERFVIPATYVNQALFCALLEKAAEEFGIKGNGPILIPCHPLTFRDHILQLLRTNAQLTSSEIEEIVLQCCTPSSSSSSCCASSSASSHHQPASAISCS